jgi:hypothetical protein
MTKWEVLDPDHHALTLEYSFRPGTTARSFAVRYRDDELAVLSPPVNVEQGVYDELREHGRVTALVATNGMHWLGLEPTHAAFPEAEMFAPEAARKRIGKKNRALNLKPLSELRAAGDAHVQILEVPGFSIGDVWAVVSSEQGSIWFVSDSCFNLPTLPDSLALRLLLKWTKTAPGLCMNGIGNLFFLKDKAGYRRWFEERLETPPNVLIPAHGAVVRSDTLGDTLHSLVEERL